MYIDADLVILEYLVSPFTWDKVFKVLRTLPNHVKNQRLLVHILYYILFNYIYSTPLLGTRTGSVFYERAKLTGKLS